MEVGEVVALVSGSSVLSAIFTHAIPKLLDYWGVKQNTLLSAKQDLSSVNVALANQQKEYERSLDIIQKTFNTSLDQIKEAFGISVKNLEETTKLKLENMREKIDSYKNDYNNLDRYLRDTLTKALASRK